MTAVPFCRIARGYSAYGVARLADHALEVDSCEGLFLILRDDVNLVVWRRGRPPEISEIVNAAPDGRTLILEDQPLYLRYNSLTADVHSLLAGLPAGGLADDIEMLASAYMRISGLGAARPRLERVETDSCRLFHTDTVGLRLICSYAGPGTEWLPDADVARAALGKGVNAAICPDMSALRSISTGDVAVMKGEAWPGNAGRGLVHRSPPIAGTGLRRLVFTLDACR